MLYQLIRRAVSFKNIGYGRNAVYISAYSICCIIAFICLQCKEDAVDSLNDIKPYYYSDILHRKVDYSVVMPSDFQEKKAMGHRYPVLYLLHCAGCDHNSYIEFYHLLESIDKFDMIVAMPYDGSRSGWWLDSPIDTLSQLSTWLTGEFKNYIDSSFPTFTDRSNTGIAGHSMGGFGAFHNLALYPDIFGAAFSAKGLFDMVGHEGDFMAEDVLGPYNGFTQNYHNVDLIENVKRFIGINAPIRFYSGSNDWFFKENMIFDSLLTLYDVPHTYFENDEEHYGMSSKSMHDMLQWFDSLFTRDQGHIRANSR